jgi:hypothetical protein
MRNLRSLHRASFCIGLIFLLGQFVFTSVAQAIPSACPASVPPNLATTCTLSSGTLSVGSSGSISTTNVDDVDVTGSATSISNDGLIGTNLGISIKITTGNSIGTIGNTGTISSAGNTGILNIGSITSLTNSGTISGFDGIINNTAVATTIGTINNGVTGSITGNANGINNGGTITTIINDGTISGTVNGINVNTGNLIGSITNSGTITGGVGINNGGTINTITNSGNIDGTGGTAISLSGLISSTSIVLNGGHINGDVIDNNPGGGFSPVTIGGTFATGGNFTVSDLIVPTAGNLTISPANTFTASHMTGGTGLGGAGTLTFGVLNSTPGSGFGKLIVHNAGNTAAINLSGLTVTVDAATATLANHDQMLVGHGDVTLIGTAVELQDY